MLTSLQTSVTLLLGIKSVAFAIRTAVPAAGLTVLICELDVVEICYHLLTACSNRDGLCWDAKLAERVIFATTRSTLAETDQHQP